MPWKACKLLKRLIHIPFGIESMMLEIICLSKSGRSALRPAQNLGGKALGLPALKKSLLERKMRNKTVNGFRLGSRTQTEAS